MVNDEEVEKEIKELVRARNDAFKLGDDEAAKTEHRNLMLIVDFDVAALQDTDARTVIDRTIFILAREMQSPQFKAFHRALDVSLRTTAGEMKEGRLSEDLERQAIDVVNLISDPDTLRDERSDDLVRALIFGLDREMRAVASGEISTPPFRRRMLELVERHKSRPRDGGQLPPAT